MGKIFEYVILLGNILVVLGTLPQTEQRNPRSNYEREKQENFTLAVIKQYSPKKQNEFFNKKINENILQTGFSGRRRSLPTKILTKPYQTPKNPGFHGFSPKNAQVKTIKRDASLEQLRSDHNIFKDSFKKNVIIPQNVTFDKDAKIFRPEFLEKPILSKHTLTDDIKSHYLNASFISKYNNENSNPNRRYYKERTGKVYHPRHNSKICDPCNSVPWIPLFKVPNSYRQQRNHPLDSYKGQKNNFYNDHQAYSSNNQKSVLPLSPLVPPAPPIYDGTISSSFGLPLGNIPTSHGLTPPINHFAPKINRYGVKSSLNYLPLQSILDTGNFPEISPVPSVPIHDSGPFVNLDVSIPDLVPPLNKPASSSVVLTIAENSKNSASSELTKSESNKVQNIPVRDLPPKPNSETDYFSYKLKKEVEALSNQNQEIQGLEIVKSIPLAEFTTSFDYSVPLVRLPLANEENLTQNHENFYKPPTVFKNENSNINFLSVPPPPPIQKDQNGSNSNLSKFEYSSYLNPPKAPRLNEPALPLVPTPLNSNSLSWLFPGHGNTNTNTESISDSEFSSGSFADETREIASIVNNELRPVLPNSFIDPPTNLENENNSKSKKIQIIIPYTIKNKNNFDGNALESVKHEVYQTVRPPVNVLSHKNNSLRDSSAILLTTISPITQQVHQHNSGVHGERKVNQAQNHLELTTQEVKENHQAKTEDVDDDDKRLIEMQHIIAKNLRELLRAEIENTQTQQNVNLQNNIDNWTALEYSNHKTTVTKAPKEIITQALAVTSIPGTSISHLLLPSKKIPEEYFATTPLPVYDEPNNFLFNVTSTNVNSKPFTAKPYATTHLYYPTEGVAKTTKQNKDGDVLSTTLSTTQSNQEKNYSEVGRTRIRNWSRLNDKLGTSREQQSTAEVIGTSWINHGASKSKYNEKVQIVTPATYISTNYTTYRRTTRHIRTTERTSTTRTDSQSSNTTIGGVLRRNNSTRLEKVSNYSLPFRRTKFNFGASNISGSKENETTAAVGHKNSEGNDNWMGVKLQPIVTSLSKNTTSAQLNKLHKTNKSENVSINDIFPFRNKELPWETNLNVSRQIFQDNRQGKSLIKQVKFTKSKTRTDLS